MTRTDVEQFVGHRVHLIEQMLQHAEVLCDGSLTKLCDLTVASPGVVLSLYMATLDVIDEALVPEDMKIVMRRSLQFQVTRLLELVQAVVLSDDPRHALAEHWTAAAAASVH